MTMTRRSVALALSGLAAAGTIVGLGGTTTSEVSAQEATEAPTLDKLYVPPPDPRSTTATPEAPTLDELFVPPPPPNVRLSAAALDFVRRTTGKLYVTFGDGYWQWGTATVVNSESQDMLITSGSVLTDDRKDRDERPVQVRFVPGQRRPQNGIDPRRIIEPYGSWTARTWAMLPGFDRNSPRSAQNNVAVVLLNTRDGEHIQQAVHGGQGIFCPNCAGTGRVHVFSYQADYLNGETLDTTCQIIADFSKPTRPFGTCVGDRPTLGKGSSGAAVIAGLDPETGFGKIVAVNTWTGPTPDGRTSNGGSYLGAVAFALYEGYRRQ